MEIRTGVITLDQLQAQVDFIAEFFDRLQTDRLQSMFGWACQIDDQHLWRWMPLQSADLARFIDECVTKKIFEYGGSDLTVADSEARFQFRLCHEGDVHFETESQGELDAVAAAWMKKGFGVYCINKIDPALLRDNSA